MVGRLAMREQLLGPAAASCLNLYHPVAESLHVMIMTLLYVHAFNDKFICHFGAKMHFITFKILSLLRFVIV